MTREEEQYHLNSMANCIMEIENYTNGMDYMDFMQSEETKAAVTRNLVMVGRAALELTNSDEFLDKFEEIDLNAISNLRYAGYNDEMEVNTEAVWQIIEHDLPVIRDEVLDISSKMDNTDDANNYNDDIKGIL
jgi:uncharacterized protein with HEPN domain